MASKSENCKYERIYLIASRNQHRGTWENQRGSNQDNAQAWRGRDFRIPGFPMALDKCFSLSNVKEFILPWLASRNDRYWIGFAPGMVLEH